ncbi:MAG: lytic transglycosylase domain-containing protein [Desulfocapsaceae bacterium]|nr:lytic transglycosylase domain-containing protein [Desulfocapsaceae bacterium]
MLFNKIFIALLFITLLPIMASARERLAEESTILPYGKLMSVAYQEGKKIGCPETIQGLLLRETNGGRSRGPAKAARNDQCYGVMQIKLDTAKFVLVKIWGLSKSDLLPDDQLRRKIRDDDVFNIKIATSYFKYLLSRFSGPARWDKAVLSYNIGSYRLQDNGNAYDPNGYVKSVRTLINTDVQRFNSVHNIN